MIRDYIYHEFTNSLCPHCFKIVPAKIILKDNRVYLLKYCSQHGEQLELLEENASYHLSKRDYDKPGNTMSIHTIVDKGCPFDCGICPQHDQHACIGLIEITTQCNLGCPMCYADAGVGTSLSIDNIEQMMDFFQESENNQAEILQISGGEPTLHPQIIEIIRLAKSKRFKYVMLNTNGIRIAEDEQFASDLKEFVLTGGFEVYLQFDGFKDATYQKLRGRNILELKKQAIANLQKHQIPMTLVMSVMDNVNDDEVGEVFRHALNTPFVRGVNFQPVAFFGRIDRDESLTGLPTRVTLSGILERLEKQTSSMLKMSDFIPLPCNVERVAMTYLYKTSKGEFTPITRDVKFRNHLNLVNNTFAFTIEDALKNAGMTINDFKTTCDCFDFLKDFRHMVPFDFFFKSLDKKRDYIDENTFRISVSYFVDAYNFDMKSMQKECVHIITPDLKKIPFSAYNMIHRGHHVQ